MIYQIKLPGAPPLPLPTTASPADNANGVRERTYFVYSEVERRAIDPIAAMPQIIVDSTTTHIGDMVTVNVSVKNNPGIIVMLLQVDDGFSVLKLQKSYIIIRASLSFCNAFNKSFSAVSV